MARPKRQLTPQDYLAVEEMLDRHCSWKQIAKGLRMDYSVFRRLRAEDETLNRVIDEAMEAERADLHGVLYEQATKEKNIVAAMFLLKTRHGYRENAPIDVAVAGNVIMLPSAASPEDYARMVAQGSSGSGITSATQQAARALPAAVEVERG